MPHPAIRFSQLAAPKVPFLYNENHELGEELVASHLDQVIRSILAIGLKLTITDASSPTTIFEKRVSRASGNDP